MAVTTTNNVSKHIFHPHLLFIGKTGRNIESRPGEAVESEKIFQLIHDVYCKSSLQGRVFSILFPLLEISPESLTFPECRKYSVRTSCHDRETEPFQNNKTLFI